MPARITKFFHSRYAMLMASALMVLAAWSAFASGQTVRISGDSSIALPPVDAWIASGSTSLWMSVIANLAITGMLLYINHSYNLLRSLSMLFVVLFASMTAAIPGLSAQFHSGTLLALVLTCCISLMFGCYGRPRRRREVFMVFFLLSGGAAVQYAFVVYIPVMLLCCIQMRVMSARTAAAAVLGMVTPWWLLIGLGLIAPGDIHAPHITNLLSIIDFSDSIHLAVTALLTACVFTAAVVLDLFRTMAYNARSRSYNGTVVLTGFVTIIAMAADYNNAAAYMPVLNMCAALQAAQFFIIHRSAKSWIGISCLLTIYLALYTWTILI